MLARHMKRNVAKALCMRILSIRRTDTAQTLQLVPLGPVAMLEMLGLRVAILPRVPLVAP